MDHEPQPDETLSLRSDSFARGAHPAELRPALVVMRGLNVGLRYLLNEDRLVVGRAVDLAQIVLPDRSVSGAHAVVTRTAGEADPSFSIQDLGSRNGTYLNGVRLESSVPHPLRGGDRLEMGETTLKFTLMDAFEGQFYCHISDLMYVDDLTGLVNKRRFDADFQVSFEAAVRRGEPLSVLMLDMDRIKQINDTHGHQYGAHSIASTGKLIGAAMHPPALATRFGGDEFIAYLPGTPLAAAVELAKGLVEAVRNYAYELEGIRVYPTLSAGVAAFPDTARTREELVRHADEALYRAKQQGRDRVST